MVGVGVVHRGPYHLVGVSSERLHSDLKIVRLRIQSPLGCLSVTMAPTEVNVEWQTSEIIKCLFEDEDDVECNQRSLDACLETDGPPGSNG